DTTADLGWFLLLERGFWWTIVLPVAIWFHVSSLIDRQPFWPESRRRTRPLFARRVVLVYTAALCVTLFGSIGDLIVDYAHPTHVGGSFVVGSGAAYPIYIVYLGATAAGALFNLMRGLQRFARRPG